MMARATRSTADLKRKRSAESAIDGLGVLEAEDTQGLLDRVFPLPDSDQSASLRALLTARTPVDVLKSAIAHLRPISSLPRAKLSPTAAQQLRFCNLALALLDQLSPSPDLLHQPAALPSPESPPPRIPPSYALVQHLPSGDYWSSVAQVASPNLHTANAELVAVLPTPSSSSDAPVPTLAVYSKKPLSQKRPHLPQHRRITTGAFLDYGPFTSFAPSFDQDGELVGRNQLGQALWYRDEKKRQTDATKRLEGTGQVTAPVPEQKSPSDLQLETLLPPEDVDAIKAALNSLELEKSVQTLLDQNQRALQRLEQLQFQRLTKHPSSTPEEDSEEWETAHAILDSLTLLASLRPRSSSQALTPPPSILHKLHLSLALEPSPGWHGTLPPGRTTALRDDATVKVRPGAATPAPAPPVAPTPNTFAPYSYPYGPQHGQSQPYRPTQAAAYTPYKPGQPAAYYQGYAAGVGVQQQGYYPQTYAGGTSNQQPYGAAAVAAGAQPYTAGYSAWYGQYPPMQQQSAPGGGSGPGTPQPVATTPTTMAPSYGSFFNAAATAATASGTRTPAIANTVAAAASNTQLPVRNAQSLTPTTNGSFQYPVR